MCIAIKAREIDALQIAFSQASVVVILTRSGIMSVVIISREDVPIVVSEKLVLSSSVLRTVGPPGPVKIHIAHDALLAWAEDVPECATAATALEACEVRTLPVVRLCAARCHATIDGKR